MKAVTNYFSQSWAELRKVVWPTRKQAIMLTATVIGVSLLLGIYLTAFSYLYQLIIQRLIFRV